jgi:hypothetical protein
MQVAFYGALVPTLVADRSPAAPALPSSTPPSVAPAVPSSTLPSRLPCPPPPLRRACLAAHAAPSRQDPAAARAQRPARAHVPHAHTTPSHAFFAY